MFNIYLTLWAQKKFISRMGFQRDAGGRHTVTHRIPTRDVGGTGASPLPHTPGATKADTVNVEGGRGVAPAPPTFHTIFIASAVVSVGIRAEPVLSPCTRRRCNE